METAPAASIDAIVTDPPYGVKEYELAQLEKRSNGNGGVWRVHRLSMEMSVRRCQDSRHCPMRNGSACKDSLRNGGR